MPRAPVSSASASAKRQRSDPAARHRAGRSGWLRLRPAPPRSAKARSPGCARSAPSTATMTSPGCRPAAVASPPPLTLSTSKPLRLQLQHRRDLAVDRTGLQAQRGEGRQGFLDQPGHDPRQIGRRDRIGDAHEHPAAIGDLAVHAHQPRPRHRPAVRRTSRDSPPRHAAPCGSARRFPPAARWPKSAPRSG